MQEWSQYGWYYNDASLISAPEGTSIYYFDLNDFVELFENGDTETYNIIKPIGTNIHPLGACRDLTRMSGINIPDSVTEVGDFAFYGSGLYDAYIPPDLKLNMDSSFPDTCGFTAKNHTISGIPQNLHVNYVLGEKPDFYFDTAGYQLNLTNSGITREITETFTNATTNTETELRNATARFKYTGLPITNFTYSVHAFEQFDGELESGSIDSSGNYVSSTSNLMSKNFMWLSTGTYTITAESTKPIQIFMFLYTTNNAFVQRVGSDWSNFPYTLTIPESTTYKVKFAIKYTDSSTMSEQEDISISVKRPMNNDFEFGQTTCHDAIQSTTVSTYIPIDTMVIIACMYRSSDVSIDDPDAELICTSDTATTGATQTMRFWKKNVSAGMYTVTFTQPTSARLAGRIITLYGKSNISVAVNSLLSSSTFTVSPTFSGQRLYFISSIYANTSIRETFVSNPQLTALYDVVAVGSNAARFMTFFEDSQLYNIVFTYNLSGYSSNSANIVVFNIS